MELMKLITHPESKFSEEKLYIFRKNFTCKKASSFSASVFADTRYKLYINGQLVSNGPCRGNVSEKYYNEVEIGEYLKEGTNLSEAVVLQLKNDNDGKYVYANLGSVIRSGNMVFGFQGTVVCENEIFQVETDESWDVAVLNGITLICDKDYIVGMNENILPEFFAEPEWKKAVIADDCVDYDFPKPHVFAVGRYTAKRAPIPEQRLHPISLAFDENNVCDAGELTTAYLEIVLKGKGSVRFTYAECKTIKDAKGNTYKKDRTDPDGNVEGYCDIVQLDGKEVVFRPFWFRTFRFIKAEITGDVTIKSIEGLETGYPLNVEGSFESDSMVDNKLWEISLRTLKRCMQETYTDCPYYEQEQYLMDTRAQALFTYQISNDDRQIRRTLCDFTASQYPSGILCSKSPDKFPQIIPGFSFYFIFIMHEHYLRFADKELIRYYIPTAEGVIRYFRETLSEKGLVKRSGFWNFVDWVEDWAHISGVPIGEKGEDMTIYTLMYIVALKRMAFLYEVLEEPELANRVLRFAEDRMKSVKEHCFDAESGLFADGPSKKYFSVHAQIWAVLSGIVTGDEAKNIMEKSEALSAQPTYAYIYDYLRALEMCGLYHKRNQKLDALRELISLHCTTVPETPGNPRSECHGWGATVLYEFAALDLGVRVTESCKLIEISPYIAERNWAKGVVIVKGGEVSVSWRKENGSFIIDVDAPQGYTKRIFMPDGNTFEKTEDKISLSCKI